MNLVFQQANVLRIGLDQSVEGICGSMGTSLWVKSTWQRLFTNNMVIICTAEVLVQCMMHSFISMSQINLLIFDEAHHAKGNHPYARLMKDLYTKESDDSKRPRIFGMTASPVDVRGNTSDHIKRTANDLEKLLHAKIVTTSESALASNSISRPTEEVAIYAKLQSVCETPLHGIIKARYADVKAFEKLFLASNRHGIELGRWAADMYWSFAFADEQSSKLQQREEVKHNKAMDSEKATGSNHTAVWDDKVKQLAEAAEFIQQYKIAPPTVSGRDLSTKVQQLQYWLSLYYERSDEARCIVFVEQRQTARLLKLIFESIGGPHFHCDMLVGVNNRAGEQNISLREQVLTVARFRRGEVNCLFATSVAEEGLDIPQCNLVVRFDLYRTMIAYVQSRGRARHRNSKYLHMLEDGNNHHRERLLEVRYDEQIMRDFCRGLSHDRKIGEFDDELTRLEDKLFPSYVDATSGAKLTYRSSLAVLNHYVATLPGPRQTMLQPSYIISPEMSYDPRDPQRRGFVCEVTLPDYAPIVSMISDVQPKKAIAKCSAAYKMCIKLREKGYLSENLLPTDHRRRPEMANAHLAINEKGKGQYPMLIKPTFWKRHRGTIPVELYLTVVDVDAGLDRPHQPLGLLTRDPIPEMPQFPIYLADGRPSNVVFIQMRTSFLQTPETLDMLTSFTLRIYKDIYNKEYEYDVEKVSYWVVPILKGRSQSSAIFQDVVDVEQIQRVHDKPIWQWTPETKDEDLCDKYFVDPLNGGRRYYSNCLAPQFQPQDPLPAHIPRQNHKFMNSILDYTDSKWSKTRDLSKWNPEQPVLDVEKIPFRRNHLACAEDKEKKELDRVKIYICPQPLHISNVSRNHSPCCTYVLTLNSLRRRLWLCVISCRPSSTDWRAILLRWMPVKFWT